jgi:hypothetical protein
MGNIKLFMLLLGCKPKGRFIEQHDIFFGIGNSLKELVPAILESWPEAPKIHIDAWREVTEVDGFTVSLLPKESDTGNNNKSSRLFFLNLGGYKENEFEEYHYKMLVIANDKADAVTQAKQSAFYKHTGFKGADSHIDDRYGVDVDDIYEIEDILPEEIKENYFVSIQHSATAVIKDEWHLGYTKLSSLTG